MSQEIKFWDLLKITQEFISQNYAAALTDMDKLPQLKAYLKKYLRDKDFTVSGYDNYTLITCYTGRWHSIQF